MQFPKAVLNVWTKIQEWNSDLNVAFDSIEPHIQLVGFLAAVIIGSFIFPYDFWLAILGFVAVFRLFYLWPKNS
jgi:hypothetical protein